MFRWHSIAKSSTLQAVGLEDNSKISMRYRGKPISHFWHRLNPTSRVINGILWALDKKRISEIVESATIRPVLASKIGLKETPYST